eukprot:403722-Lingulodinium_polyedra.AAC.1
MVDCRVSARGGGSAGVGEVAAVEPDLGQCCWVAQERDSARGCENSVLREPRMLNSDECENGIAGP